MHKLLLLSTLLLFTSINRASTIEESLLQIETTWARIYYSTLENQQSEQYLALLTQVEKLVINHPQRAEPLIWQAIIIATNAERQSSFEALDAIHKARNILQIAININPLAMEGSAFVTLGSLYSMVPGWPIAFGDDKKAQQLLMTALEINPDGIDSNYFFGEYLLSQAQNQAAAVYFQKAIKASSRPEQLFADTQLKAEAQLGLKNAKNRKVSGIKNFFTNLFYSATAKIENEHIPNAE